MAFNAPNIKGPRFRKSRQGFVTRDVFKKFIKLHPQHTGLKFKDFKCIVQESSKGMRETAINERDGISLPMGGTIFVGSVKIRKKNNYNIQASIAANAPIKHRNHETDGHSAKIMYSPYLSKISGRDRSIWSFKGHRNFKRALSEEYPKDWKKYIVPVNLYKVVKDYHRHRERNYRQESTARATLTYNEFDI
jgi:hypothetical protein